MEEKSTEKKLISKAKIKSIMGDEKFQVSSDFADALNEKIAELVKNAIERAKANKRKTIKPCDL